MHGNRSRFMKSCIELNRMEIEIFDFIGFHNPSTNQLLKDYSKKL